jgi:hypothetical protein
MRKIKFVKLAQCIFDCSSPWEGPNKSVIGRWERCFCWRGTQRFCWKGKHSHWPGGVGAVYEWFWGGLSITGAFTVTQSSALVGIYIGASACGWTAVRSTTRRCPFGKHLGPFKCSRATGFTISLFCCGIDLVSGENSCR